MLPYFFQLPFPLGWVSAQHFSSRCSYLTDISFLATELGEPDEETERVQTPPPAGWRRGSALAPEGEEEQGTAALAPLWTVKIVIPHRLLTGR